MAKEACGGGTPDLGFFLGVSVFIGIFGIRLTSGGLRVGHDIGAHPGGWARPTPSWAARDSSGPTLLLWGLLLVHKNHRKFSTHSKNFYFCTKNDTMVNLLKTASVLVSSNQIIPKPYKIVINMA